MTPHSSGLRRATQVIVVGSVMFSFISFWRTAAVVLCDLASTVYYIGGIVENAIGPAAPWFILAVMIFSYAVRNVYIESCSLFVRGGVYRVVKQALGGFLAKLSVSALMFDYILTGPTSGVSAGQYILGLILQFLSLLAPETFKALRLDQQDPGEFGELIVRWGSVGFAMLVTLYFLRQNLLGIHESSGKALKIMIATTLMAVIIVGWCGLTIALRGPAQGLSSIPDLNRKVEHAEIAAEQTPDPSRYTDQETSVWVRDPGRADRLQPQLDEAGNPVIKNNEAIKEIATVTGFDVKKPDDPLGFLGNFKAFGFLRVVGILGLFIAFGHSILAMSGEETLAQVYREVEAPKLVNFKRAAFIVFVYSLLLTAGVSFLAVLIIPDEVRMKFYSGNLISGLARHVVGPPLLKLGLETFVVVIGVLILAGAVNTAIIGSNGVLSRIAEDGVLPEWFLKPHPRYGTSYRLLYLIAALQIGVIALSMGHMLVLGEAYAFGVVWSFVFKGFAMVVLRFKDKTPREYRVPFNLRIGGVELPLGLIAIFLVLLITAILNFFTKEVATVSGVVFTSLFLAIFTISERAHRRRKPEGHHIHLEQFTIEAKEETTLSQELLHLEPRAYLKLIAIRSPQNLFMLETALAETDPETTNVVVMTAKLLPQGAMAVNDKLDVYEQQLMTAVVDRAEKAGKPVKPLIVPTNQPLNAVLRTARDLQAKEVVIGASNKYATDMQLEEVQFNWLVINGGQVPPLSVRVLGRDRDVYLSIGGGQRIPKISERQARNIADLRAAGVGVRRVLLYHDGTARGSDLFRLVLTMVDPKVPLDFAVTGEFTAALQHDLAQAAQLDREVGTQAVLGELGPALAATANDRDYDLVVMATPDPTADDVEWQQRQIEILLQQSRHPVFVARMPEAPRDASRD